MKPIDLSVFPKEREQALKEIYRYSLFEVMLYRSNIWEHCHRILWLAEEILPTIQKYISIDSEKVRVLAMVHDDEEMITGDIPAGVKAAMSPEEQKKMWKNEKNAADILAKKYPKEVAGYSYRALLTNSAEKDCVEAQLVSYLDKLDAYCESLHEVLAGNINFLRAALFYERALFSFPIKYPALKPLFVSSDASLFLFKNQYPTTKLPVKNYVHFNKPHTDASLSAKTDFPFYNVWRKVILKRAGKDGKQYLLKQREFLPK